MPNIYKVKFTHHTHHSYAMRQSYFVREGVEVYRHPEGYFVVLEFQGKMGKFRESFYINELMPIS